MSDILSIGASGVSAYRKSLEVTGSNIANANTEGYVHRDATLTTIGQGSTSPLVIGNPSGSGVNVSVVSRATDNFLRNAVWAADATSAQAQALANGLGQLEKRVLMPPSTVSTTMQKFFASIQDIANAPSSQSARIAALDSAQQVVDQFHSQVSALSQEASFAETNISTTVTSANAIIKQLANVNSGIAATTGSAQMPNDLLDQRDKLIGDLSNLISVTVTEDKSGKVTVFLGDTTSGPKLVDGKDAKYMGTTMSGEKLDFIYDPGGQNTITNQVHGGSLAGLSLYRSQCLYTRDNFNKLALAFANNLNTQHEQGVDLAGNQGLAVFSTDTLSPVASPSNRGDSKASVDLDSMGAVSNDTYTAIYDETAKTWTVTANKSKNSATGTTDVKIDGLKFHFEGNAKQGDNFTAAPLKDAAAGLRLMLKDPSQWAMSLPTFADTNASNAGSANIIIQKIAQLVPPPNLPPIQSVFGQSQIPKGALGVKSDGVVTTIPSGASNVTLSSLKTIPAATFKADLDPLFFKQENQPKLSMTLIENGVQTSYTLDFINDIASTNHAIDGLNSNSPQGLADSINAELKFKGFGNRMVASVANGAISINALGNTQIKTLSLSSNATIKQGLIDTKVKIDATVETGIGGTNLQVFTREGRQLSGPVLSPSQAAKLLTVANGFNADAKYVPPSELIGYRGVSINSTDAPLAVTTQLDQSQIIKVSAFPATDGAQATDSAGSTLSGAVYDLNLPSLNNVRLAGSDILGKNSIDIAAMLASRMTAQATSQSVQGNSQISWSALGNTVPQFNVNVDGVDQTVRFVRDSTVSGTSINWSAIGNGPAKFNLKIGGVTQEFTLTRSSDGAGQTVKVEETLPVTSDWANMADNWTRPLTFAVNDTNGLVMNLPPEVSADVNVTVPGTGDAAALGLNSLIKANTGHFTSEGLPPLNFTIDKNNTIAMSIPKALNTTLPMISITSASSTQLTAMGLNSLKYRLTGAAAPDATQLAALPGLPLSVKYKGIERNVTLNGTSGTVAVTGGSISWSSDEQGRLTLSSDDPAMSINANTASKRNNASNLGFMGSDLTMSLYGDNLSMKSSMVDGTTPLIPGADASNSVSRVAHSITIGGPVPEDLIVAVQSSNIATNTVLQGVQGTLVPAIQTIAIPSDWQTSDTLKLDIPGMDFGGVLYLSGAHSVTDLSSLIQNKINLSSAVNKPTVRYDLTSNKLVIEFADLGPKPSIVSAMLRGNQPAVPLIVNSTNNGIKPGTGVSEVQNLTLAQDMRTGDSFDVTLKLTSDATDLRTFKVGPLGLSPKADFVDKLNAEIAAATGNATPAPVAASIDTNGKVTFTWHGVGDVPEVNVSQLNAVQNVQRSLIASYPVDLTRTNPIAPDITVRVIDQGKIEILDKNTGKSLANRHYSTGETINYMGLSFKINGNAQVGDNYTIVSDTTRTGDNRNAALLGGLQSLDAYGAGSGNFQDIYASVAAQLSSATQAANDTSTSAQQSAASLLSAYDSKIGVSLDTEAANLLRFQQAYQASAEVINTAKTMFDTILKMM